MRTIHKYVIPFLLSTPLNIRLPKYAKVLTINFQCNSLCLWAEINTKEDFVDNIFYVFPTGEEIKGELYAALDHLKTIFYKEQNYVYHVYKERPIAQR